MNDQDIERLLHETAPAEAPFAPRVPRARRSGVLLPLVAAGLLLGLVAWLATRADRTTAPPDRTRALIAQLAHPDAAVREAAARTLRQGGEPARLALARAAVEGDPEIRTRARALLRAIAIDAAIWRSESSGVFAIHRAAYEHIGDDEPLPSWMEPLTRGFPYVVISREETVRLHLHETRAEVLPAMRFVWDERDRTERYHLEPVPLPRRELRSIFTAWSRIRDSDLVLVAEDDRTLLAGLASAAADGPPTVRRAAVYALRQWFTARSVETVLQALAHTDTATVARDTLTVLIDPPAGADPSAWWSSLAPRQRAEILEKRCAARRAEMRKP